MESSISSTASSWANISYYSAESQGVDDSPFVNPEPAASTSTSARRPRSDGATSLQNSQEEISSHLAGSTSSAQSSSSTPAAVLDESPSPHNSAAPPPPAPASVDSPPLVPLVDTKDVDSIDLTANRAGPADPPPPSFSLVSSPSMSAPSSPLSHASFDSPRHPGRVWSHRQRSSTNGSSSRSTTGSDEAGGGGFVMPSMRVDDGDVHHDKATSENNSVKLLILGGRSPADRKTLARLLGGRAMSDADTDLSMSLLSARLSERSRNSSRHTLSGDLEDMVEELPSHSSSAIFFHPNHHRVDAADLASRLAAPLEELEGLLNPNYPTTQRLAELVANNTKEEIEACLMLFSSPPTLSEVGLARTVSHVLPIFPILILPPSPTSRPQKTGALVQAVCAQLTSAGVRWTSAFETLGDNNKFSPLYMLPSTLFNETDNGGAGSSGPPSLSSSQELHPPSPTFSTRSASPVSKGDLLRLQTLVSSHGCRERIHRNRVIAFLEWREVELAARGLSFSEVKALRHDALINEGERLQQLGVDFSKRVAERRAILWPAGRPANESYELTRDGSRGRPASCSPSPDPYVADSFLTDPTTPRCAQRPLPLSSESSADSFYVQQTMADKGSYFANSATSSIYGGESLLLPMADPFHLPSLLHLVGLNLRLHLLPLPNTTETKERRGLGGWVGTAVFVSAVYSLESPTYPGLYYHSAPPSHPTNSFTISFLPTPPPSLEFSPTTIGLLTPQRGDATDGGPPPLLPRNFTENKDFVRLLHEVLQGSIVGDESVEAWAVTRGEGFLHIADERNPADMNRVPDPADIIASIFVKDGEIDPESYLPGDMYRLVTTDGLLKLPKSLMKKVRAAMERVREAEIDMFPPEK
ncbi:hypothetical protein MNV49_001975 [Pseudohyphozyma bogoriensis]|nr:hypothetical protein MNV49_001975 [Pseudohyphozyma bogoriensis]